MTLSKPVYHDIAHVMADLHGFTGVDVAHNTVMNLCSDAALGLLAHQATIQFTQALQKAVEGRTLNGRIHDVCAGELPVAPEPEMGSGVPSSQIIFVDSILPIFHPSELCPEHFLVFFAVLDKIILRHDAFCFQVFFDGDAPNTDRKLRGIFP